MQRPRRSGCRKLKKAKESSVSYASTTKVPVECGISTLEKEFMPFMAMRDGRPMHQHVLPVIDEMTRLGKMPAVLMLEAK